MYKQFYKSAQTSEFWEQHWTTSQIDFNLPKDNLILSIVRKYAKEGIILEAGCGLGQFVKLIADEGKKIIGLDFATKTLFVNQKKFPELKFISGDITRIPFKKNSIVTYVSLGVVEHFEEGPEKALENAHEVLSENGILICSVPYHNLFRKIIWKFLPPPRDDSASFYQYYFTKKEFIRILEKKGFEIIAVDYYGVRKTLTDLMPKYKKTINEHVPTTSVKQQKFSTKLTLLNFIKTITRMSIVKNLTAHMIIVIAKPK